MYLSAHRTVDEQRSKARGKALNRTRWHCDGGPIAHARILVYLNPTDEHDSATWLADLQTTTARKRAGYVHCQLQERLADLTPSCERLGLPFEPARHRPDQGEALVFELGQRMHKAELPTRDHRDSLHIVVIPWLDDWRVRLDQTWEVHRGNLDDFPPVNFDA